MLDLILFRVQPGTKAMTDYRLMYLARRNPAIAPEDFGAAWLSHARYAEAIAPDFGGHFRSARQCVKIAATDLPESFRNDRDGAALLGMKDWAALVAVRSHPIAADELLRDEDRVFAERVAPATMTAEARTIMRGGGRAFILSFLKPAAGTEEVRFHAAVEDAANGLANVPGLSGLVCSRIIARAPAPNDFAALLELRFPDAAVALAAARDAKVIAAIEQASVAQVAAGVRMVALLNQAA